MNSHGGKLIFCQQFSFDTLKCFVLAYKFYSLVCWIMLSSVQHKTFRNIYGRVQNVGRKWRKKETGVLFSGRNLGCCGGGGGSYYNCFLAITIMSPRREVGRFEDEPTRSIERSCGERKRACKSPLLPRPKAAFVIVSIERRRGRLRNAKHAPPVGEGSQKSLEMLSYLDNYLDEWIM